MPPVVGALVLGLGAEALGMTSAGLAATSLIGSLTVGGLLTVVTSAGLTVGASLLMQVKRQPRHDTGHIISPTIQSIGPQSIAPRYFAAGRIMAGGIQHLYECPDGLHLLIGAVINCEPIDGLEAWLVDGEDISDYLGALGDPFPYLTGVVNGVVAQANIGPNVTWPRAGMKFTFMYTQAVTLQFNGAGQPYFTDTQVPIGNMPAMCFEFGNGSPEGYVSQIANYFWPTYWNGSFRCADLACIYAMAIGGATIVNRFAVYPRGFPQISVVIRGATIFDPRDATQSFNNPTTWKWSRNAVLILFWYMTHYDGARIPGSLINWASVAVEADYADEPVTTLGATYLVTSGTSNGSYATVLFNGPQTMTIGGSVTLAANYPDTYNGTFTVLNAGAGWVAFASAETLPIGTTGTVNQNVTEPRFSCDCQWNMGEAIKEVLARLQAACDATIWEDGSGLWNVWCAKPLDPTITLTDIDISAYEFQELTAALDEVNYLQPSYMEPRENYQLIPGVPAQDLASISAVGERSQTITLKEVASPDQAYRLAYRALKRQNPPIKLSVVGGVSLLRVVGELVIGIQSRIFPDINGTYRFTTKSEVDKTLATIKLNLAQVGPNDYADVVMPYDPVSPVETTTVAPTLPMAVQSPDAPVLAIVTSGGHTYITSTATTYGSPPTNTQLVYYAQYTPVDGSGNPTGATVLMPTIISQWVRESYALPSGQRYAVQGWFVENGTPSAINNPAYITTP